MYAQTRQQMIPKIHIGKNQLKMDTNSYRLFLLETVDKHSCSVMSDKELMIVLKAMQAKGFRVQRKNSDSRSRYLAKINAYLNSQSLSLAYVESMSQKAFGVAHLKDCSEAQLRKLLQMLAVHAKKHGKPI